MRNEGVFINQPTIHSRILRQNHNKTKLKPFFPIIKM